MDQRLRLVYFLYLETRTAYLLGEYASNDQGGLLDQFETSGYKVVLVDDMGLDSRGLSHRLQIWQEGQVKTFISNSKFFAETEWIGHET